MSPVDKSLSALLADIRAGKTARTADVLQWLGQSSPVHRAEACSALAQAFADAGNTEHARSLARRAFTLSQYSSATLEMYIAILVTQGDVEEVKRAYKLHAIRCASDGNIPGAVESFTKWQRAYTTLQHVDKYTLDPEVTATLERLAAPYTFSPRVKTQKKNISLGYLIGYGHHVNSVLLKLDAAFVQHYQRDAFHVTYAFLTTEATFRATPQGAQFLDLLEEHGCASIFLPEGSDQLDTHMAFAKRVYEANLDILAVNAVLAEPSMWAYFVAALRPAPHLISIVHGPIAQYSSPLFDHAICSFYTQLVDAPIPATQVNIELPMPALSPTLPFRQKLNVPDGATVLCCGGRYPKFQERAYWESLITVLRDHPNAVLFALGFTEDRIPPLPPMAASVRERVRFFDWSSHFADALSAADIFIDSYPAGGGVMFMEALARNIPVVSFRHNYYAYLDGSEDSGADEVLNNQNLIVERGDFALLIATVNRLIEQPEQRKKLGLQLGTYIRRERGNPERMVRRFEEVFSTVAKQTPHSSTGTVVQTRYSALADRLTQLRFSTYMRLMVQTLTHQMRKVLSYFLPKRSRE